MENIKLCELKSQFLRYICSFWHAFIDGAIEMHIEKSMELSPRHQNLQKNKYFSYLYAARTPTSGAFSNSTELDSKYWNWKGVHMQSKVHAPIS